MRSISRLRSLAESGKRFRPWYALAAATIHAVAIQISCDPRRLADILALTSPRTQVRRNIKVALGYVRDGFLPRDVTINTRRALAHYEATGEIRGRKTGPFAAALKGDERAIVIDVWMCRALGVPHKSVKNRKIAEEAAKRLRSAALELGWPVTEVQAAVWAAIVMEHGRNPKWLDVSSESTLF